MGDPVHKWTLGCLSPLSSAMASSSYLRFPRGRVLEGTAHMPRTLPWLSLAMSSFCMEYGGWGGCRLSQGHRVPSQKVDTRNRGGTEEHEAGEESSRRDLR